MSLGLVGSHGIVIILGKPGLLTCYMERVLAPAFPSVVAK